MDKKFGLKKNIIKEIIRIITSQKKPEKIVIFGSRAKNKFLETSDIDIAIFAKEWSGREVNIVKNRLDEFLKTPLKIDVLNFYAIKKEQLKKKIIREGKVIYGR